MDPILHLSIPVRDLTESIEFYVDVLGCETGRVNETDADVWFFGMQVTLQQRPDQVRAAERTGVRHFGVTLGAAELHALVDRVQARSVEFASALSTDNAGTAREQTKAKIFDPSGNVIELKTYPSPAHALQRPQLG